jgi:nitrite reductase/ring-hydroxylating ferredoxin subunit
MNRRNFLLASLAAAAAAGCQGMGGGSSRTGWQQTFDAGPAANYAADGVYSNFRDFGFFVIRRGATLEALSSICTHRQCKLTAEEDHSFYCHCHGSTFDPNGKVTDGPAARNLPVLATFTGENGHLMVRIPASVT